MPAGANDQLLDLCFLLDVTGSMIPYIKEAEAKINYIDTQIRRSAKLTDKDDLHVAVVAYRDYNPQDFREFVSKDITGGFTSNIDLVKSRLAGLQAIGGGDAAEAVGTGLSTTLSLNWRPRATKILILITDAPPHGYLGPRPTNDDKDPLLDRHDVIATKISVEQKYPDLRVFVVKCGDMRLKYPNAELFYEQSMTHKKNSKGVKVTNGATVILKDAGLLADAVIGLALENHSLREVINDLRNHATGKATGKFTTPTLHEHLLLIANPRQLSKDEMVDTWDNATSVYDVGDAIDKHAAGVSDAKRQVKKLLAGTSFTSIKSNVYVGSSLAPEEVHNVKIWDNASSVHDIYGIKAYNRAAINATQTLHYEHGPINDHQIMRLASMYSDACDEDGDTEESETYNKVEEDAGDEAFADE